MIKLSNREIAVVSRQYLKTIDNWTSRGFLRAEGGGRHGVPRSWGAEEAFKACLIARLRDLGVVQKRAAEIAGDERVLNGFRHAAQWAGIYEHPDGGPVLGDEIPIVLYAYKELNKMVHVELRTIQASENNKDKINNRIASTLSEPPLHRVGIRYPIDAYITLLIYQLAIDVWDRIDEVKLGTRGQKGEK